MAEQKGKRTRDEIIADILKAIAAEKEAGISVIARKANLNFYQRKLFIRELLEKGLITRRNRAYALTESGAEFLADFLKWHS